MTSNVAPLILFGGTFNPVHLGHLNIAKRVLSLFDKATVSMIPAHVPPHKNTTGASFAHRAKMVELALQQETHISVDTIEAQLPPPNYTMRTLQAFRATMPERPICFLIGGDSLSSLHTWYQWESLLDLAHLVVYQRPNSQHMDPHVEQVVAHAQVDNAGLLASRPYGLVYRLDSERFDVSSTQLRAALNAETCDNNRMLTRWLAPNVLNYIRQNQLYID